MLSPNMPEFQDLSRFKVPFGFRGRSGLVVLAWQLVQASLFGLSPQPCYAWRRALLRLFGAKVGKGVVIRPTARVTYPWKVEIGDHAWIGDHVELYSLDQIKIGKNAVVSQRSYLCTASHDIADLTFSYRTGRIEVEAEAWVAADCFIAPGVHIGRGAVVGARSSVFDDVEPAVVAYGSPARVRPARPIASKAEPPRLGAEANVFFVGQFPPPVNGLTFITSKIAAFLKEHNRIAGVADISGTKERGAIRFHASRLMKTLSACTSLVGLRCKGRAQFCYLAADGGLGLIYTIMVAGVARLLRTTTYIHHHSFSYINRPKVLMRFLLATSGSATHIFLSDFMARAFQGAYSKEVLHLILSNAAFVETREVGQRDGVAQNLRIGLLSNLSRDKGLHCFLEIIEIAQARGLPVEGVLAGPLPSSADREMVEQAVERLPVRYLGPVYDNAKSAFFQQIDIFVFPTQYVNEAQPTVVFEALASGVPVIATDKGTIREQVRDAGLIIEHGAAELAEKMLDALLPLLRSPELLESMRKAAREAFARECEDSHGALLSLCRST